VLLEIEEPHMYNIDDAIAKIDGYVISISGGGPFVGERRLVRINEVRRTAAYASLLTENGGGPAAADGADGEVAEPVYTEAPVAHVSERAVQSVVAEDEPSPEPKADGQVESRASSGKRRRGRRGGRRRSRTKASNSESSTES
jgi:hypothetical protein